MPRPRLLSMSREEADPPAVHPRCDQRLGRRDYGRPGQPRPLVNHNGMSRTADRLRRDLRPPVERVPAGPDGPAASHSRPSNLSAAATTAESVVPMLRTPTTTTGPTSPRPLCPPTVLPRPSTAREQRVECEAFRQLHGDRDVGARLHCRQGLCHPLHPRDGGPDCRLRAFRVRSCRIPTPTPAEQFLAGVRVAARPAMSAVRSCRSPPPADAAATASSNACSTCPAAMRAVRTASSKSSGVLAAAPSAAMRATPPRAVPCRGRIRRVAVDDHAWSLASGPACNAR